MDKYPMDKYPLDKRRTKTVRTAGLRPAVGTVVWLLVAGSPRFYAPWSIASDRCVGGRPLSGKETGTAGIAMFGSWGIPRYERLGDRAVGYHGGLNCYCRI